jgi:nitrite reductase/ring-hydroxylating ferredoxin subunit
MLKNSTTVGYKDLKEGKPIKLEVNGKEVALVLVSGRVYAMDAVCSHEGGPLEQGSIKGCSFCACLIFNSCNVMVVDVLLKS